ncbi:TonB-dependent receptor [candidate division KSB1 bacterium]|nr:TonB-dependent receptor [candidate division KSB1 bacterium]
MGAARDTMVIRICRIAIFMLLHATLANAISDASRKTATLKGKLVEVETGEPVAFVNILLQEINRSITSDQNGDFILFDLPAGQVTLKTFRIGYRNIAVPLELTTDDTLEIVLALNRAVIHMGGVTVESSRAGDSGTVVPDILFSDKKLHQALGQTIAQTIDYEPGISQRTMGPAPARPVLRGLSGDRLLMLEDNEQTGDLSATSTDHAVVIEPMTAERIEVIRGPEALIYGSNTLGGAVNIIRGYVPSKKLTRLSGSASVQGESVNRGFAAGMDLTAPLGPLTARVDGSYRNADDVNTPEGILHNTTILTKNASAGLSVVRDWGFAGAAASDYQSDYGIPPDPSGGHPSGVDIKLDRRHMEMRSELRLDAFGLQRLEASYNHSVYFHQELESNGDLGMEFGVVSDFIQGLILIKNNNTLKNGVFGIRTNTRDYASGGLTFTPNTFETAAAGFYYQEIHLGRFLLHGSIRYDYKNIDPGEDRYSRKVGLIRRRTYGDFSAAVSPHWLMSPKWSIGVSFMRTFRAPTTEELFSEGPHLAAYSYEVGNADLNKETGIGLELFLDYKIEESFVRMAIYQNDIYNYTFPKNTGEKSWTRADLYVYQYVGEHALMRGAELSFHLPLAGHLHTAGSASYVWGELLDHKHPLPYMPPLEGKVNIGYELGIISLSASMRTAAQQNRVGEFEAVTAGYTVFDFYGQFMLSSRRHLHSFSFTVENIFNSAYRKHLNRVREVMPEPGRNFRLLYKIFI